MRLLVLAPLAATVAAVLVAALTPATPAFACRPLTFREPEERLKRQVDGSDAIVVGEVVAESVVGHWIVPARPRYTSVLRTVAVLKGDVSDELVVPNLGWLTADCSGGPRLVEGEHVLLFLSDDAPDGSDSGIWRVALAGQGKYQFVDGEAFFERSYEGKHPPEPAGAAGALIRDVGRLASAPADQIELAVEFAEATPVPAPVSGVTPPGDAERAAAEISAQTSAGTPAETRPAEPRREDARPLVLAGSVIAVLLVLAGAGLVLYWR